MIVARDYTHPTMTTPPIGISLSRKGHEVSRLLGAGAQGSVHVVVDQNGEETERAVKRARVARKKTRYNNLIANDNACMQDLEEYRLDKSANGKFEIATKGQELQKEYAKDRATIVAHTEKEILRQSKDATRSTNTPRRQLFPPLDSRKKPPSTQDHNTKQQVQKKEEPVDAAAIVAKRREQARHRKRRHRQRRRENPPPPEELERQRTKDRIRKRESRRRRKDNPAPPPEEQDKREEDHNAVLEGWQEKDHIWQ